uniref:Uncharacterized protein n=1 Tax=Panagrolaimus sp. JU765 TaxID=591449 RepID=A0AC34RSL4_9BILA
MFSKCPDNSQLVSKLKFNAKKIRVSFEKPPPLNSVLFPSSKSRALFMNKMYTTLGRISWRFTLQLV